jgi:transcriptional regulator with XRE-family HTH domain
MSRAQKAKQTPNVGEHKRTLTDRPKRRASETVLRRQLGRAIRELRKQAGINQGQLADKLTLGQANVSRYERGRQWVESVERLHDVAHALDVPLWLLFFTAELSEDEVDSVRTLAELVRTLRRLPDAVQRRELARLRKLVPASKRR